MSTTKSRAPRRAMFPCRTEDQLSGVVRGLRLRGLSEANMADDLLPGEYQVDAIAAPHQYNCTAVVRWIEPDRRSP